MARILTLYEANALPEGQMRDWAYGALDATGTREVFDVLEPQLLPEQRRTYALEKGLQAPAFQMTLRGVKVDMGLRGKLLGDLKRELTAEGKKVAKLRAVADFWDGVELEKGMCPAEFGKRHLWPRGLADDDPEKKCRRCGADRLRHAPFNPQSPDQVMHLLYDLHRVTPYRNFKTGALSTDDDILEKIGVKYPDLKPFTDGVAKVRDLKKQIGTLSSRLTADNRFPSSFNVGAAWTGRFSSSKNPFGEGGNLQNIGERHRKVFIPDPGYEIGYADLKQAESLTVAYLAEDPGYIEAHISGDTHTYVSRLLWPDLPWTGDLKKDKKIAKETLPEWDPLPGHDLRFQSKRIQHGSNYGLSPYGIAVIAHIPVSAAREAQQRYFTAFPGIPTWQDTTYRTIAADLPLLNPIGRRWIPFGRTKDDHVKKQALAFVPQSLVADVLDMAMWRVWKEGDPHLIQLLAQVHDAILFQSRKEDREAALELLVRAMTIRVPIKGREMVIPVEIAMGGNWGHADKDNPNGIQEIEI